MNYENKKFILRFNNLLDIILSSNNEIQKNQTFITYNKKEVKSFQI